MLEGSFSAKTAMDLPLTTSLPSLAETSPWKTPWVESSIGSSNIPEVSFGPMFGA